MQDGDRAMETAPSANELFFERTGMDRERATSIVGEALHGADDGELFLEFGQSESLVFDDGRLREADFNVGQGLGLRRIVGEAAAYAHTSELSEAALRRAAGTVRFIDGRAADAALAPPRTNRRLYGEDNPLGEPSFEEKVALLEEIDSWLRGRDDRVHQVSARLLASWQVVAVLRPDGSMVTDVRPLVSVGISCVARSGDRMESGYHGCGGRMPYRQFIGEEAWKEHAGEALRIALVNLESVDAPAGEMPVVLGPGWPAVMLHEAVGHGLEGDFNRKKTSAFSGLMGERVAVPGVTVIDDGTIEGRRGSLTVDDEGTPTERTVLIEDGILTSYMCDRMNARLMGGRSTGNARRQSHAHQPMPRMTNTCMLSGDRDPREIIESVGNGLYAVNFAGGQVDIVSGTFNFTASEAYLIEDGRVGPAVKGATLIGDGPSALRHVTMVGNDMRLDPGIGSCGKEGQIVPVGVGQPSMLIEGLTVGGTRA